MSGNILSHKLTRRTFLKTTAATAAVVAVGDKLFGGPVSTLVERAAAAAPAVTEDKWIPTSCRGCRDHDPVRVRVVNGVAVKVDGIPGEPQSQGRTCGRAQAGIMTLYNPYRVKAPLKRTNPEKGLLVDPKWVEITWDEALDTVAGKLKPVLEKDWREFGLAHGFGTLVGGIIGRTFGSPTTDAKLKIDVCGGGFHLADIRTTGDTVTSRDSDYCDYAMIFGSNARGSGKGSPTVMRPFLQARERGMKVVVIDPAQADQARMADEWIPIRPATDQAFALAMLHALVHEFGLVDWEFIRLNTNGPYLIAPDGDYVRSKTETYKDASRLEQTFGKPYIWDPVDNKAKTFDDKTIKDFALEGTYTVDGVKCQPAWQLFKEFLKPYTAEWAEPITTVPAATIRRIAKEYGEASRIGATMTFHDHPDGPHTLPLRPVAVTINKGGQGHYWTTLICRAVCLLRLITGATNVVGSTKGYDEIRTNPRPGPDGVIAPASTWASYKFAFPPADIKLNSLLPPRWSSGLEAIYTTLEPEKHNMPFRIKVRCLNFTNDLKSRANPLMAEKALKVFPFQFGISYHFDEPTEMCDIVLPEPGWPERWEVLTPRTKGHWEFDNFREVIDGFQVLRQPVVKQVYNTKDSMDIMMEIAARMGMLAKWNAAVNANFALKDEYKLKPDIKYEWKDVLDRQLKNTWGEAFGVEWFKVHGVKGKPAKGRADWYGYVKQPKTRYPLYEEWMVWQSKQLKADRKKAGLPELHVVAGTAIDVYSELIPLPEWKGRGPLDEAAPEYDLYVVNWGDQLSQMGMMMDNPWMHEFMVRFRPDMMGVWVNSETAEKRGIKNGDRIKVTSQFGHTVDGEAFVTECINPECVGIGGCYGGYSASANPISREGTHVNWLFSTDPAHWGPWTGQLELSPKVKIYKA